MFTYFFMIIIVVARCPDYALDWVWFHIRRTLFVLVDRYDYLLERPEERDWCYPSLHSIFALWIINSLLRDSYPFKNEIAKFRLAEDFEDQKSHL